MADGEELDDGGREALQLVVASAVQERECWERAEDHLRLDGLRSRLEALHIEVTPSVAVALMASAMFLAEAAEEFGGDARDVLGDLAALGLGLLDDSA